MQKLYTEIDVHTDKAPMWPDVVPELTEKAAALALRRLYRWGIGLRYEGRILFSTGNRRPTRFDWLGNVRVVYINVSKGWREFIHDLSHDLDILANGESKHGKHHARLERNMVKEVLKRGWLTEKPSAIERGIAAHENVEAIVFPQFNLKLQAQRVKLERLQAREARWESKAKRAANALKKIARQTRYCERAIAKLSAS